MLLRPADGRPVRLQLLSAGGRVVWPTERRTLFQRYANAPVAELLVPTLPTFAASKTATWTDRRAARDLWDLWALSGVGAIDADAASLFRRYGPTNKAPTQRMFDRAPTDAEWQAQLAGQARLTVKAAEALASIREAWRHAIRPARTVINGE